MNSGGTQVWIVTPDQRLRNMVEEWVGKAPIVQWYRNIGDIHKNLKHAPSRMVILWDASLQGTPDAIRTLHRTRPDAKIIVLSPSPDWCEARKCFRAGAADYLPIHMTSRERTKFKERLQQWLN